MKKVFTHENRLIVFHIKNLLEEQGISCSIKNEFASGGVGDLSPFETWPEIWVDDEQSDQADQVILENARAEPMAKDWVCTVCGEVNDSQFKICWKCNAGKRLNVSDLPE